jgi:hypothetical protein
MKFCEVSMPKMKMFLAGAAGLWLTLSPATARVSEQSDSIPVAAPDPQVAAALKAVSAQQVQQTIEKLVSFQTRHTLSSDVSTTTGKGINAAAEWIRSEFEGYSKACGGCLEVKTDEFTQEPGTRVPKPTKLTNVYAILRGSDPANASRIFLVTGHYDSRNSETNDAAGASPGANDDASGTAVSLECARVLSQHRFPATIVFVAVAGEEQGLYGSARFAKMAKAQGWDIEAVLNNDIVGGDRTPGNTTQDPRTVRVFSEGIPATATEAELKLIRALGGENDGASRQLARYIAATSKQYIPVKEFHPQVVFRRDRYLRGGDHISFNEQGFAAVRFTEYRENYDHQHQNVRTDNGIEYGDLPKFVDYDYTANVARVNAATLASLASAPAPPAKVRVLTKALQNDSTLVWEASPGGLSTGYLVLWRDTGAPEWEHAQAFGNVTQATVPLSKDNVVFAVQATDVTGHRSLPAVPVPER